MSIKEKLSFIGAIISNLNTKTLEASFDLNDNGAQDPDLFNVSMFKELSKRYIQEVRDMGFRTILH